MSLTINAIKSHCSMPSMVRSARVPAGKASPVGLDIAARSVSDQLLGIIRHEEPDLPVHDPPPPHDVSSRPQPPLVILHAEHRIPLAKLLARDVEFLHNGALLLDKLFQRLPRKHPLPHLPRPPVAFCCLRLLQKDPGREGKESPLPATPGSLRRCVPRTGPRSAWHSLLLLVTHAAAHPLALVRLVL